MQKDSFVIRACDFITKYSIYALVFLVPIFFLPWTTDVLEFNKQALLILLVFVSLFALMLKILVSGKFEIKKSPMHIVAGVLFLAYLLATIFSTYKYGSFWGQPQASESMLTALCLLLFYFLLSNVFSKKDIFKSIIVFSFSSIIVQLIGILQLFKVFVFWFFDFTKSAAFNTIGSAGSLGFFAAISLPIAIALLIAAKKWWRVLFVIEIVLSTLILILINYAIVWWVVMAGSALILILGAMKRDLFDGRWMALPMFFLAVSLFFVLLNLQTNLLPINQRPNEYLLNQATGLNIATQTLKINPILGSGPGTFVYDFLRFRNSSLWSVTSYGSSSKVLNNLATMGIIGFLAVLAFMIFPIFYGIRFLATKKEIKDVSSAEAPSNQIYSILLLGLSVAIVEQVVAYFIYYSNITLDFVFFFLVAALIGIISENKKEYVLKPSSLFTLILTLVFTLVFIVGAGLLILDGQRYAAEVSYYKGLAAYQAGQTTEGLNRLESAASLNPGSDVYFRQLSYYFLLASQNEVQGLTAAASDQEKTKIKNLIQSSVNAGNDAASLNPKDVNNLSWHGYVCQSLIGLYNGASDCALNSYDSALKLDPNNPYLFFQEGTIYFGLANTSSSSADKSAQLAKAQTQLEKAVALYPGYYNALFYLGLVYDGLGQKDKAIAEFTNAQQLNPQDTNIPKILNNLNAGRSALQSATAPTENPPSTPNGTIENPPATGKTTTKTK